MDTPVSGAPRLLLRLEGSAVLVAAIVGFHELGSPWTLFALLFLVPDIALVAYLGGPRAGAVAYNAAHTYLGPATLGVVAYLTGAASVWPVCLIWAAHIGMDRALGLGLKFSGDFRETHLGPVGRAKSAA
jgi:hypothetical protein